MGRTFTFRKAGGGFLDNRELSLLVDRSIEIAQVGESNEWQVSYGGPTNVGVEDKLKVAAKARDYILVEAHS